MSRNRQKAEKKDRNTEGARDRNRSIKLSMAPLAMTDSRVNVAWLFQWRKGFLLMFYSSAKREILFLFCRLTNPLPLKQTSVKQKPSRYGMTSLNHDQAYSIKLIICHDITVCHSKSIQYLRNITLIRY